MNLLTWLLILVAAVWAFERFYLRGGLRKAYPRPSDPNVQQHFSHPDGPGPGHQQVVKKVIEMTRGLTHDLQKSNIYKLREVFDSISDGREYDSQFIACDAGGVPAETYRTYPEQEIALFIEQGDVEIMLTSSDAGSIIAKMEREGIILPCGE